MKLHNSFRAFALCWPNDDRPLLFLSREVAEENKRWFSANYKRNRDGQLRGEPFIAELAPNEN